MKINKKVLNGVLGAGVLGVVLIGGAFAYLTDNDIATYAVTIGDVEVELDQANALDVTKFVIPNEELSVKPYIKNTGTNDAVVFMEVVIPIIDDAYIVTPSGMAQTQTPKIVDLFTIDYGTNLDTTNWVSVDIRSYDSDGDYLGHGTAALSGAATVGYVYGYKAKLVGGGSSQTEPLFTNIKAANFTEEYDESNNTKVNIPVKVYAIQAEYVYGSEDQVAPGGSAPTTTSSYVTDLTTAANLTKIFNTFVNQNYASVN